MYKQIYTSRLDLKISPTQHEFIRKQAYKYKCSLAEFVRRMINFEIQTEDSEFIPADQIKAYQKFKHGK